jgi:hypothetical protein
MSHVTNVILSVDICEESYDNTEGDQVYPVVDELNRHLWRRFDQKFPSSYLPSNQGVVGGRKALECILYIAAFNNLSSWWS